MIGIATIGRPNLGSGSPGLGLRFETSSSPRLGSLGLKNADSVVILRSRDLLQIKAMEGSKKASVNGKSVGGNEKNPTDLNEIMMNGHAGSSGNFSHWFLFFMGIGIFAMVNRSFGVLFNEVED